MPFGVDCKKAVAVSNIYKEQAEETEDEIEEAKEK